MPYFSGYYQVRVKDTSRVRKGHSSGIGREFYLDSEMAADLNNGFPIEDPREFGGYTYTPDDLEITRRRVDYSNLQPFDEDVAEARRMGDAEKDGPVGPETDLDRMERTMDLACPYSKYPSTGAATSPQVKAMREELKVGNNLSHWTVPYEHKTGFDDEPSMPPVLIQRRGKKKRREIMVELAPTLYMPSLRH